MTQPTPPASIIIEGGRTARVGGAVIGTLVGLLLLLMASSGLRHGGSKLTLLIAPGAFILMAGAFIEARRAFKPSRLFIDAQGITLEDALFTKRWTWGSYHGAMSNRMAVTRYRVFVIVVDDAKRRRRDLTIGPFPADLAETLQKYAASVGREVRLVPPFS